MVQQLQVAKNNRKPLQQIQINPTVSEGRLTHVYKSSKSQQKENRGTWSILIHLRTSIPL